MSDPTPTVTVTPIASPVKAGWLTSEHLLTLLALLLVTLEGSGVIPSGSGVDKWVQMAVTVLAALGYTAARTALKAAA